MRKSVSSLKKKCWKLCSIYIRLKYANKQGIVMCVTCGKKYPWKQIQAGHFIDGRTNSILFDERGISPQCYACNVCKKGNKVEYYKYMQDRYGEDVIDDLRARAKKIRKFYGYELELQIDEYKQKISELILEKGIIGVTDKL